MSETGSEERGKLHICHLVETNERVRIGELEIHTAALLENEEHIISKQDYERMGDEEDIKAGERG